MTDAQKRAYKKWAESEKGRAWQVNSRARKSELRRLHRMETRKWLDDYRASLKCSRCDEDHPSCLEFHHKGDKSFQIGDSSTRDKSIKKIKAEIAKCVVLCSNCHKKMHWSERSASQHQVFSS